ncbi:unnamed protein product, partial [Ectocarpus sp. 4 AP-2014]
IDSQAEDVVVIFAADLDGDGDLDLLAGSYSEDWVRWYKSIWTIPYHSSPGIIYNINENARFPH